MMVEEVTVNTESHPGGYEGRKGNKMFLVFSGITHIECDRAYLPNSCPVYEKRSEQWVKYNDHCKYDGFNPVFERSGMNAVMDSHSGAVTYLPKNLALVNGRKIGGKWYVPYTIVRI